MPVAKGEIDTAVVLGLDHQHDHSDDGHHHGHHHDDDHGHDHHDHSHVEVVGRGVQIEAALDRSRVEALLPDLVRKHQVLRLKGRLWLAGKALPLQVQMVGPRLNSWFEAAPEHAWRPSGGVGADLVVLALKPDAADAIEADLQRLVQATPATANKAAATPRG